MWEAQIFCTAFSKSQNLSEQFFLRKLSLKLRENVTESHLRAGQLLPSAQAPSFFKAQLYLVT